jgi:hypothetical protein
MLQVGITRTVHKQARPAVMAEARVLIPSLPWLVTTNYFVPAVAASR